jgi:quinoprotein glucose dehydrogenase
MQTHTFSRPCSSCIAIFASALLAAQALAAREGASKSVDPPNVTPAPVYDPNAPIAWDEATRAEAHFKKPSYLKVSVWAAEPQLVNPVAMTVDDHNRIWIAESNRFRGGGVLDIRNFYGWVVEDLACRTVEDRAALVKRIWPDHWKELAVNPERVRMLQDSSGGGRCDRVSIFADGYHQLVDGIASGVLVRKGDVYFANIPSLYLLRDTKGTGAADKQEILSTGYGVHNSLEGHDLHGLRFGPDGKLYFSMGDRGFNVKTREDKHLYYPDEGAVLRCDPDGANLEVFARGLRNPQKLCFDDHGNLFTGDNNSDHGDPAKWFYVVEGADCGWRIGYQHILRPKATGALLLEDIMAVEKNSSVYYNTPPIAHIANGPSGCTYYPGTGMPESFNEHFLLCDFKGGTLNSGILSFTMKPRGASFEMEERQRYLWQILPTDCEFATDGGFFVADWINGWERPNRGRIYRFYNETAAKKPVVGEVKRLLDEGFEKIDARTLGWLLGHADQRVRLEAQYELAERGEELILTLEARGGQAWKDIPGFNHARQELARLHAVWGLGQIARKKPEVMKEVVPLLEDNDEEVRAQAAKVLGDAHEMLAYVGLIKLLNDQKPRVQFFAAQALGKLGEKSAAPALIDLLARNADKDAYIRHTAVFALANLGDREALTTRAHDESASVRLGIVEVMRRLAMPEVTQFLADSDPRIVAEAARAINDVPIEGARAVLAKVIDDPKLIAEAAREGKAVPLPKGDPKPEDQDWPDEARPPKLAEPVLRRAINANFRLGAAENAAAVAKLAANSQASELLRIEAIEALEEWDEPSIRDHVTGLVWPLPQKTRDATLAADAARPVLAGIVKAGPEPVRIAGLELAEKVGLEPLDTAYDIVADVQSPADVRAAALKVLAAHHSPKLSEALRIGLLDAKAPALRREAIRLQTTQPDAVARLGEILGQASPSDQQAVFGALAKISGNATDAILSAWMDKLLAGSVPAASRLDLLEAARHGKSPALAQKIKQFDAARKPDDTIGQYRECLEGGDAKSGRTIFFEKAEVGCVRCHSVGKEGSSSVGPNLGDVGKRQPREYILESIVAPNAKIAPGFESAGVKLKDGRFLVGVVKDETESSFKLDTGSDQGVVAINKADVVNRKPAPSPMPEDVSKALSKRELRDLVEFLSNQRG